MATKHASGLFGCAILCVATAAVAANGCSGDSGARDAGGGPDTGPDMTAGQDTGSGSSSGSSSSSGSGSSSGSASDSGMDTSPPPPSACGFPSSLPMQGLLYNGGVPGQICPTTLDTTNYPNNSWFSYNDGTVDGGTFVHMAQKGGCDGPNDCAFHASGSGYTGYGAGVGFTLNNNAIFDAMAKGYMGLQVWLKGTTSGTRGTGYAKADNTVHVKFLTGFPEGGTTDPRNGDDYGTYCSTQDADGGTGDWIVCPIPFTALSRDGFRNVDSGAPDPTTDAFDPQNLVKIQLEFSSYTPPPDSGVQSSVVSFDIWIDDIAWM